MKISGNSLAELAGGIMQEKMEMMQTNKRAITLRTDDCRFFTKGIIEQ